MYRYGLRPPHRSHDLRTQSLHAILVAELADNDAWDELIALSGELGQNDMASQFEEARNEERAHLNSIRQWHKDATLRESKLV